MLTSSTLPTVQQFFPLGNTPANSLTRTLPQGVDANILSLGTGDVRNILYTAYCECGFPPRKLDFTCCDCIEDIHVRNILLLSFFIDNWKDESQIDLIWDIYYHLYVDNRAVDLLTAQVDKLAEAAGSAEQWRASPYGRHLRFCDSATFHDFQKGLSKYKRTITARHTPRAGLVFEEALDHVRGIQKEMLGDHSAVATSLRTVELLVSGSDEVEEISGNFHHYWEHGTTSITNSTDDDLSPNPMFAASLSTTLLMHHTLDPIQGFHLAIAYPKLAEASPLRISPAIDGASKYVKAARTEFRAMAKAFQEIRDRVVVRFVTADALVFCHTLQNFVSSGTATTTTPAYTANWFRRQLDGRRLELDPAEYGPGGSQAPAQFDVVDTSDLGDDLGVLNLLVAGIPLLVDRPSSSLLTELPTPRDVTEKETFLHLLCGHTPTVALLLGVCPVEYHTNVTSEFAFETLIKDFAGLPRRSLSWKLARHFSGSGSHQKINISADDLVAVFMTIFRDMFFSEKPSSGSSDSSSGESARLRVRESSNPHFHRGSLAAVMRIVKDRVVTDWKEVCENLTLMTYSDPTLVLASHYLQDFAVHMHMWDVHTEDWVVSKLRSDMPVPGSFMLAEKTPPPLSAVAFVIPRGRCDRLIRASASAVGSPTLVVGMRSEGPTSYYNQFADVQFIFGTVRTHGERNAPGFGIDVVEDPQGWEGTSPLIACFYVPTTLLQISRPETTVALELNGDPHTMRLYASLAHEAKGLHVARLSDQSSVYITEFLPGQDGYPQVRPPAPGISAEPTADSKAVSSSSSSSSSSQTDVTVAIDRTMGRAIAITGRADIVSNKGKRLVADQTVDIGLAPSASPFVIDVVLGRRVLVRPFQFPAAVTSERGHIRIARVSSWMEVICPLAEPIVTASLDTFMYPIARDPHGPPATLSVPHVNLDVMPILDVSDKTGLQWLVSLASSMHSPRERAIQEEAGAASSDGISRSPRVNFKESLFALFTVSAGLQGGETGLFKVHDAQNGGINMLIFVSALRLDGVYDSVVADAAVIPLTNPLLRESGMKSFAAISPYLEMCTLCVGEAEMKLWKRALPGLSERCRTWEHEAGCEYAEPRARIPLGMGMGEPVLCHCGQGKFPDGFITMPVWDEIAPLATRIAISPAFCMPYAEEESGPQDGARQPVPIPVPVRHEIEEVEELSDRMASLGIEACRNCDAAEAKSGGPLKKCSRCLTVMYCSVECQKKDWQRHRRECHKA